MSQDSYSKMVNDGRDFIDVLESTPENKRFLLSMMAEAFLNGLNTGERLALAAVNGQGERAEVG